MVNHSGDLYTDLGMHTCYLGTLQKGYNPNCAPLSEYAHFSAHIGQRNSLNPVLGPKIAIF